MKYVLSGEGAGTVFVINEDSGDLHATRRLDREEKASYTLSAKAVDKATGRDLEGPSTFTVKIHDINDNEPKFTRDPYVASVQEMADVGEASANHCRALCVSLFLSLSSSQSIFISLIQYPYVCLFVFPSLSLSL